MHSEVHTTTLKVPAKLYRIGELVRYTPFSRQTIHNYTTMGLIREAQWTEGGHRLYDESVFPTLSRIMELKRTKTLWEIRQILTSREPPANHSPAQRPARTPQQKNDSSSRNDAKNELTQIDF